MRRKWWLLAPVAIAGFAAFIALGGYVVQQLWNWLMPAIFGLRALTFWQGLGLLALCRILFGGFKGHGPGKHVFRRKMGERWDHMSPEERDRFRQGMRGPWGWGPPPGGTGDPGPVKG
jgi:hypothetical protein